MIYWFLMFAFSGFGFAAGEEIPTYQSVLLKKITPIQVASNPPPAIYQSKHYNIADEKLSSREVAFLSCLNESYEYLTFHSDGEWAGLILSPLRVFITLSPFEQHQYANMLHSYARHFRPDDMPYMSKSVKRLWQTCGLQQPYWVARKR